MLDIKVPGKYITNRQAAEILGLHYKTVTQRIMAGKFRVAVQDTAGLKMWYVLKSEVEDMAREVEK